jgi:hypothetical protein
MQISSIGPGVNRIHERAGPTRTAEPPVREHRAVPETAPETKTARAEQAYARDVDMRRRIEASESRDTRALAKEFKHLGKELGHAILAEAREQGLDKEQIHELRSILKDFRHELKDTLRHDMGRSHEADRPSDALGVVESFTNALEELAQKLVAFVGTTPAEEPAVDDPAPEPVEVAVSA